MSEEKNNPEKTGTEFGQTEKHGGITVETQHIFPIIKKWLYSDKDIFLREIVSNASDAVTKLKRLDSLSEYSIPEGEILEVCVELDKEAGTLTVTDNGIGMTEEELSKYICSIALSGALDFIQKYEKEDGNGTASNGIIGHFGLGFYSSFMVADTVEIDTLSYTGCSAVHWTCTENGEYSITPSDRSKRGTSVIMHISDNEKEYLDSFRIKGILDKYCSFMPVPVYFEDGSDDKDNQSSSKDDASNENLSSTPTESHRNPVNETTPLWAKNPSEISDEEYNSFYHKLFEDIDDPLFHIHINADYPLNFRGILYFPKIRSETQSLEGHIKLYYNQVFVADNIKEILPDYLLMLRGALDCPELPLNVSRSYLQDNQYVKRIAQFIVKKVADKLNSLCNTDREKYEKVYNDLRIFIEYACIRDQKFYERVKDSLLLKLTDGKFMTIDEYLEANSKSALSADGFSAGDDSDKVNPGTDKEEKENDSKVKKGTVYYSTDISLQTKYISMLNSSGINVSVFDMLLDSQYLTSLEQYRDGLKFVRVDSDISSALEKDESNETEVSETLVKLIREISGNEKLEVKAKKLKDESVPAVLLVSEHSRRFEDMMKLYTAPGESQPDFPLDYTLTLNAASPSYSRLCSLVSSNDENARIYASFVFRLAQIAQKKLSAEELSAFLSESYKILNMI